MTLQPPLSYDAWIVRFCTELRRLRPDVAPAQAAEWARQAWRNGFLLEPESVAALALSTCSR